MKSGYAFLPDLLIFDGHHIYPCHEVLAEESRVTLPHKSLFSPPGFWDPPALFCSSLPVKWLPQVCATCVAGWL